MFRSFAIIPAAGRSERMGAHKLLLPLAGRPLIEHVLAAWAGSNVTRAAVVVRPDDTDLAACCRRFPVDVIVPSTPPEDMKRSVQLALDHLTANYAAADDDALLLAPADLPGLTPTIVDRAIREYEATRPQAVVPTFGGKRGHPLVLSWARARDIQTLAADEGVNALVARTPVRELDWMLPEVVDDVDTQADYARHATARPAEPGSQLRGSKGERKHPSSPS
jgi:molybdenum cofactor cytidylyltransferase